MTKPLGYYAGARSDHPDADILDRITEEFGSMLSELTKDDKAAVLICLVDAAVNPQQVFIQDNFFTSQNGGELWQLAQKLSPSNQLALSVALLEQVTYGGQG
ncbi:MAG TPA: hypothetical protein V6D48_05795 [Oculatellaceae cyanobacterium]